MFSLKRKEKRSDWTLVYEYLGKTVVRKVANATYQEIIVELYLISAQGALYAEVSKAA